MGMLLSGTAMFIFAHNGNNHDYTCQIDAVIVAVPEPASAGAVALAGTIGLLRRRRA